MKLHIFGDFPKSPINEYSDWICSASLACSRWQRRRRWRWWTLCDKLRRVARLQVVWKLCPGKNLWFCCRWNDWFWKITGWRSRHQEIYRSFSKNLCENIPRMNKAKNWKMSSCDLVEFRVTRILTDCICPKTFPATGVQCRQWYDVMWCGGWLGQLLKLAPEQGRWFKIRDVFLSFFLSFIHTWPLLNDDSSGLRGSVGWHRQ